MSPWHDLFLSTLASRQWSWVTTGRSPLLQKSTSPESCRATQQGTFSVWGTVSQSQFKCHCRLWDTGTCSQLVDRDGGVGGAAIEFLMTYCRTSAVWKLQLLLCAGKKSSWVSASCNIQGLLSPVTYLLSWLPWVSWNFLWWTPKHFTAQQNELCKQQLSHETSLC